METITHVLQSCMVSTTVGTHHAAFWQEDMLEQALCASKTRSFLQSQMCTHRCQWLFQHGALCHRHWKALFLQTTLQHSIASFAHPWRPSQQVSALLNGKVQSSKVNIYTTMVSHSGHGLTCTPISLVDPLSTTSASGSKSGPPIRLALGCASTGCIGSAYASLSSASPAAG